MQNKTAKIAFLLSVCMFITVMFQGCRKHESQDVAAPTAVRETSSVSEETFQTRPSDPYELERDDTVYPPVTMPTSSVSETGETKPEQATEASVAMEENTVVESPKREDETERD